ncbi:MAG: arabinogalactan endo-1,4-beta-galactosidase, partial [Fibrobacter sp.]|nr:arabinogalactan endo-1,4-beta-galactosidase [Fibrobacter sp.]
MVVLAGCNNGASGDSEEYDFELIEKQSSTSVSFDTAYFGGVSSVVEIPEISSSAVILGSSSSLDHPRSSSSMMPPRSSSSEAPPPPPSSDSKQVLFNPYIVGADISRFQEYESYGTKIYDVDGTEKDIFALLRDHGFNAVRLKTFLSPKAAYGYAAAGCGQDSEAFGDKEHVVAYAQKVKKAGFTFLLDIHYSDVWADPDTQIIPERWRKVANSDAMADSVYNYTYDLMAALKQVDALPDMVQVGNEITNGMLRDLPTS